MRIWSIAPKYLDTKGLVALWRETLLAKHVLKGLTKGYTNHPQLKRFKVYPEPLLAIDKYLEFIYNEATLRQYNFDSNKFMLHNSEIEIPVTTGQVEYELKHISNKLSNRAPDMLKNLPQEIGEVSLVPIFKLIPGDVEDWEIIE
jgi:hypothetical protein